MRPSLSSVASWLTAWNECPHCTDSAELADIAVEIRNVGRLLLATEIRSTDRYWHVRLKNESLAVYPKPYVQNVVGMLWNTMAQFQTWFGNAPYLPYGIQLLPITAISEQRDDPAWLEEMYHPFADACNEATACETDGWSVLQLAILASVGHFEKALARAEALSPDVFESAGGNGHSRSNTIWFIATRLDIEPIVLPESDLELTEVSSVSDDAFFVLSDCGVPVTCTAAVLDTDAGGFTCRERISWLIETMGKSESVACTTVGRIEFPGECGGCNPSTTKEVVVVENDSHCPPCSDEVCYSTLNRCPVYEPNFPLHQGSKCRWLSIRTLARRTAVFRMLRDDSMSQKGCDPREDSGGPIRVSSVRTRRVPAGVCAPSTLILTFAPLDVQTAVALRVLGIRRLVIVSSVVL